jgi:hypothetical protein
MKTFTILTTILLLLVAPALQAAITLTSFSGTQDENQVTLNWTTASEQNNRFFQIERSADGVNFTPVGQTEGSGTSTQPNNYSWSDGQPVGGEVYYRLSAVNFNGTTDHSTMTVVSFERRIKSVTVFPNPSVGTDIYVSFPGETANVTIRDAQGQLILQQEVVSLNGAPCQVSLNTIGRGTSPRIVYVTVTNNSYSETRALVIQ